MKKANIYILVIFLKMVNAYAYQPPYQLVRFIDPHLDITEEFTSLFKNVDDQFTQEKIYELTNYKIVMVIGFMADLYAFFIKENFEVQLNLFRSLDFIEDEDYVVASVNTFAHPLENAKIIRKIVMSSKRPVIFLGHSKGGVDILNTLVRYPETREKVKGVVTFQSPLWGTPVANYLNDHLIYGPSFKLLLRALGGSDDSLKALRTDNAFKFFKKYEKDIKDIVGHINFINFAGWISKEKTPSISWSINGSISNILLPFRILLNNLGIDNDSLVPKNHQIIPGSKYVMMEDIDHIAPTMDSAHQIDRMALTKSCLLMIIRNGMI